MLNTKVPSSYGPILQTTIDKAEDVLNALAAVGHQVYQVYGYNSTPDHNNLRCIDFMNGGDQNLQEAVKAYLRVNADRLGVEGYIANGQRYGYPENGTHYHGPSGVAFPYTGPNPHNDHVHVEFNASPIGGAPIAPTPSPAPNTISLSHLIEAEQHDVPAPQGAPGLYPVDVNRLQQLLAHEGVLDVTDMSWQRDSYGGGTVAAVKRVQESLGYTGSAADGVIGGHSLGYLVHKFSSLGFLAVR